MAITEPQKNGTRLPGGGRTQRYLTPLSRKTSETPLVKVGGTAAFSDAFSSIYIQWERFNQG